MEKTRGARKVPLFSPEAAKILSQQFELTGALLGSSSALLAGSTGETPPPPAIRQPTITGRYCQSCGVSFCDREEQVGRKVMVA